MPAAEAERVASGYAARASAIAAMLVREPGSPALVNDLAYCVDRLGRPGLAVALMRRAIRMMPEQDAFRSNLATILRGHGEGATALASYRQALTLAPSVFESVIGLTGALADLEALDQACAALARLDQLSAGAAADAARRWVLGARVAHLAVRARFGDRVRHGPFAGMVYPDHAAPHLKAPKLIGCYEAELHAALPALLAERYDRIVHLGSAEGYYVAGIGRLLPGVPTIAVDIDPLARAATRATARANGLDVAVVERFTGDLLGERSLLVSDCEGAEVELLCGPALDRCRIRAMIVETHPWSGADRTGEPTFAPVTRAFAATHALTTLRPHGIRALSDFPALGSLPRRLGPYAVYEGRGDPTPWLVGRRRSD